MKNIFKPLPSTIAALIVAGIVAHAANNYSATEGSGKTFQCTDNAGVCLPAFSLANTSGTDIGASLLTAVQAAIPAGTNIIGKVGIDQTTPGTTNAVAVRQANPLQSPVISGTAAISASAIAAQGGSNRFYMTDYGCSNSGSTAVMAYFLNGNSVGALPIWSAIVPAGGGNNKTFATPISTTANTALVISTSAASSSVFCSVSGYSGT